jgi:hypothetical protein
MAVEVDRTGGDSRAVDLIDAQRHGVPARMKNTITLSNRSLACASNTIRLLCTRSENRPDIARMSGECAHDELRRVCSRIS